MKRRIVYIMLLLMLFTIPVEAQCAMCRAVLESEEGQKTAKGINNGIVYLMIIPYVLIGLVGYFIYRNKKKTPASDS
ncbi:hypothetical protein [Aquimarina sp. 2201CG14-23]|uniref:hypothetical protein n=1 Tax=Aquimarina mycalae TaxID=3040073 RepID=UPI0024781A62|nr:hypothetical protein [Aquimarina sp. 2201CG14-23]MDH7445356.1 hypothetical protein [Aquimarina sp. 2201CG14-23]